MAWKVLSKFLFLLLMMLFVSCGGPKIQFTDQVTYPQGGQVMIPTAYLVGPGDELEVLYHIDPGFEVSEYVIETEDTLRVDFFYYPAMGRTVKVRPDGVITLPLVGELEAEGARPRDLAQAISQMYADHLKKPSVTVDVLYFNAKVEELKTAITTQDRGQSRLVVVSPDGQISLPYVREVPAAGMTAQDLAADVEKRYRKFLSNISVSVAVLAAHSNRVYVSGQVGRPNFYELPSTVSLTQLISMAGGFARHANTHQVVVISRSADGLPQGNVYNMDDIIGKGDLRADPIIKQYDVVFVPRTRMAEAALVGEALWRLIPLRFTANASYSLGGTDPD